MTEPLHEALPNRQTEFRGVRIPDLPPANLQPIEPDLESVLPYDQNALPALDHKINEFFDQNGIPLVTTKPEKRLRGTFDFAIPAHSVLRQPGQGIEAVGQLAEGLQAAIGEDVHVETTGPFINVVHNRLKLADSVLTAIAEQGDRYGYNTDGAGQTVVLDVSSPNIAKNMHLGHLRSTVIGEALTRILGANGYKTIRDNHLGDWGTQFGILSHAYSLWSDEVPELQHEDTQVAGLQQLYIRINNAIKNEKADTGASSLEEAGRQWFTRLEQGDPEAHKLWQWAWNLSMKEFQKIYDVLGVDFEYILGESEYASMSEDVYAAMEEKGIAEFDDKGRLRIIPTDPSMHPLTIRKSDGSSLYGTRELASLCARMRWFEPGKIIYVVGNEQRDYFKQVFDGFQQFAGDETPELKHLGFGPIELPEGKMSSRAGNVVFLSDVLEEAYNGAYERVSNNAQTHGLELSEEELETVAWQVAVGAVAYYDLKQVADRKITFSWDEVLNFEGNSGPYLQYTHARMTALLENPDQNIEQLIDVVDLEKIDVDGIGGELVSLLAEFPTVVRDAGLKYEPSIVSEYLYRLAHKFNVFYAESPILVEQDESVKAARILLTSGVRQVLYNGLTLLNIPMPHKM